MVYLPVVSLLGLYRLFNEKNLYGLWGADCLWLPNSIFAAQVLGPWGEKGYFPVFISAAQFHSARVIVAYVQDIAHIYEILHCMQPVHHSQQSHCLGHKHHSAGTMVRCSCLTINVFAVQAEMVAVETSVDVGNILWIFYDCLCFAV